MILTAGLVTGCSSDDPPATTAGSTTVDPTTSTSTSTTSTDTTTSTTDTSGSESSSSSSSGVDSSSSSDTGPAPEGLGCTAPVACDKGILDGQIAIDGTITEEADLEAFAGFTGTTSNVEIDGSNLVCLHFLSCLESAELGVTVFDNDSLLDVSGLNALSSVASEDFGNVIVSENDVLPDLNGFNALPSIPISLSIVNNAALETISGFTSLTAISQTLTVRGHPVLTSLVGLYDLQAVGGSLNIAQNPSLCIGEACQVACDLEEWSGKGSTEGNDETCGGSICAKLCE